MMILFTVLGGEKWMGKSSIPYEQSPVFKTKTQTNNTIHKVNNLF